MRNWKVLGLIVFGLLSVPTGANAVTVTWEAQGVITDAGASIPAPFTGVMVGDDFEVLVTFDTDATLLATVPFAPGVLYAFDPSSITLAIRIGALDPIFVAWSGPGSENIFFGNLLYARDNSGDLAVVGEPAAVDGYSFSLEYAEGQGVGLTMRGSILDIVNSSDLPTTPDPRLMDLERTVFAAVAFDPSDDDPALAELLFSGEITSIRAVTSRPRARLSRATCVRPRGHEHRQTPQGLNSHLVLTQRKPRPFAEAFSHLDREARGVCRTRFLAGAVPDTCAC